MFHLFISWTLLFFPVPGKQIIPEYPADGIYMYSASFINGKPDLSLKEVESEWYVSQEDDYARGLFLRIEGRDTLRPLVVCDQGSCYFLDEGRVNEQIAYYSRMIEIGPICLFRALRTFSEKIPIKAYNPANGRPFLEATVDREREIQVLTMWRPADNAMQILDRYSYEDWVGFDVDPSAREGDLIKGIRIYNRLRESELD